MNDDMKVKIACECAKTQIKMREEFINDFIEGTNVESLGEKAVETLIYTLTIAYNKGAVDAIAISAISNMEGGEDDD